MILHILRHGETEYNKKGIIQGSGVDISLNKVGTQQAQLFYNEYRNENYDKIYSSSLKRSLQTLQPWKEGGYSVESTALLNEINWGKHEGSKVNEEMKETYNKLVDAWSAGNLSQRLEMGESAEELYERLDEFVKHLRKQKHNKVLVCTHGRTIRAFMTLLLNLPPQRMETFSHSNTGLFVIEMTGNSAELHLKNDTTHINTNI